MIKQSFRSQQRHQPLQNEDLQLERLNQCLGFHDGRRDGRDDAIEVGHFWRRQVLSALRL